MKLKQQQKIDHSTGLLTKLAEDNRYYELTLRVTPIVENNLKRKWLTHNLQEAKNKVSNTEWYKKYPVGVSDILDSLRKEYSSYCSHSADVLILEAINHARTSLESSQDSELSSKQIKWLSIHPKTSKKIIKDPDTATLTSTVTQELVELLSTKHAEAVQNSYDAWVENKVQIVISELSQQTKVLIDTHPFHRPIAWGVPDLVRTKEGFKDDFLYCGKTLEKTVYLPFTSIHKHLTESNWIMRAGKDDTHNYLLAHILFVVSGSLDGDGKHLERSFIDFPIISLFGYQQIAKQHTFPSETAYEEFIYAQEINTVIGNYHHRIKGEHSEYALVQFMTDHDNIEGIVTTLKSKLDMKYGSSDNLKIYAVNLFINSQKNVCNMQVGNNSCEEVLYHLMTSTEDGSFLYLLKTILNNNDLSTPSKHDGFPYVFISVSAHQHWSSYCTDTLSKDAAKALNDETEEQYHKLSIDVKKIAGKIILSTAEQWLDDRTTEELQHHIEEGIATHSVKIPFYSGFRSAAGITDKLGKVKGELHYDLPQCFDGLDLLTIGAVYDRTDELV